MQYDRKLIFDTSFRYLLEFGIKPGVKAFPYLQEAAYLVINNPSYIGNVVKGLYGDIATEYGTTSSKVERAIRNSIEVAFNTSDRAKLERYFKNSIDPKSNKVSNRTFIAILSEYTKMRVERKEKE